jgi:protoporphyrinogen oxidase
VHDLIVVGGGIAGASLAFHAARAGAKVLVLERDATPGGCLTTERTSAGFWYELGAHTCYNSYGAFLELLEGCDSMGELLPRAKPVLRFLDDGRVLPGQNLGLLLAQFSKLELLGSIPRWFGGSQEGETVRSYYSRFVGARNYERVLGPMLSAVPSQCADDFPADMLFKKRPRRKEVLRSFTLKRGLQTAVERALARPGIVLRTKATARGVERTPRGFVVVLESGERLETAKLALAAPPGATAKLVAGVDAELARLAGSLKEAELDTLGFAVRAEIGRAHV